MPAKCYCFVTILFFFCYFLRFSCPRKEPALSEVEWVFNGDPACPRTP